MKRLISVAATIAICAATGGMAQAAEPADAGTPLTVQIKGQSQYSLTHDEFVDHARSVYFLDTGESLTFRQSNRHYFAELEGQPEVEIFPQAPEVFISANGTKYNFEEGLGGDEWVTLTGHGVTLVAMQ